jgi:hypothetical protein
MGDQAGTWADIVRHLTGNYKPERLSDSHYKLVFGLGGGRSQLAFVQRESSRRDDHWCLLESPIGKVPDAKLRALLEAADEVICGGVVIADGRATYKHAFPVATFNPAYFDTALQTVALTADKLERKFVGGDEF